MKLNEYLGDHV